MINFLEAIPLTVFLLFIRNIDTRIPQDWEAPFIVSGFFSLIVIYFFLYRKRLFNRILLGINIYLLSGGIAFIAHQWWLNRIYSNLQASGLLLWIIIVGVLSFLLSPNGFIGVNSTDSKYVKKFSAYLLIFSVCAFAVSYGFRGNRILSETVPFFSLFVLQSILKAKIENKTTYVQ